jgi:hypothetical protein
MKLRYSNNWMIVLQFPLVMGFHSEKTESFHPVTAYLPSSVSSSASGAGESAVGTKLERSVRKTTWDSVGVSAAVEAAGVLTKRGRLRAARGRRAAEGSSEG